MVVKAPREILDMNRAYLDTLETSSYEDDEDGVDGPVKHMSEEQAIDYVIRVGGNNSNNKNKKKSFDKDLEEDESEDGQVWWHSMTCKYFCCCGVLRFFLMLALLRRTWSFKIVVVN